jgi:TolA-binding protein
MEIKRKFPLKVLGGLLLLILLWSVSAPVGLTSPKVSPQAKALGEAEEALESGDFVKAEALLRGVLERHPGTKEAERAGFRLGDALFYRADLPEKTRYTMAVRAYKEALRQGPKSPLAEWALLQIANAYRLQGKFFMASTFYQRLEREFPEGRLSKQATFGRAEAYYGIRQYALSRELYMSFVEKYPDDEKVLRAMVGVANSFYHLEKYEEALAAYDRLTAHPAFTSELLQPEVRYPMAEACFRTKDYACAKERFTEFYNLYPHDERGDEALARMGDVYVEQGQPETALIFYQEVVSLFPDTDGAAISKIRMADLAIKHSEIAKKLAVLEPDFDVMETYTSVAQSKAARPLAELAHYKKAKLMSLQGRHLEAIKEFSRLREKHPTGNLVEHSRASAVEVLQKVVSERLEEGEGFKAIELYLAHKSIVAGSDFQPYALYCLVGRAYLKQGMPDRAAKLFFRVVEVEFPTPKDEEASWLLGKAYVEAGEIDKAEKQLKGFLAQYPESPYVPEARFNLGKALFLGRRFTEASGLIEDEVRGDGPAPVRSEALLLSARTHKSLARKDEAVRLYRKLLALEAKAGEEVEPHRRSAAYELADLLFEMSYFGEALTAYQDAVKRYPKDHRHSWAELQMGRVFQRLGRKSEAKEAYQALAEQEGGSMLSVVAAEYQKTVRDKVH